MLSWGLCLETVHYVLVTALFGRFTSWAILACFYTLGLKQLKWSFGRRASVFAVRVRQCSNGLTPFEFTRTRGRHYQLFARQASAHCKAHPFELLHHVKVLLQACAGIPPVCIFPFLGCDVGWAVSTF